MSGTKVCASCGIEKPMDAFNKNKRHKDGLSYSCRECDREYHRRWYAANRVKAAGYSQKYRDENKEMIRERSREYYHANKERCLANSKRWAQEHKEILRKYKKRYDAVYNATQRKTKKAAGA